MESAILAKLGIDPAFIFLFMLLVSIHISIMEKNETKKGSQTETSISMKGCWW